MDQFEMARADRVAALPPTARFAALLQPGITRQAGAAAVLPVRARATTSSPSRPAVGYAILAKIRAEECARVATVMASAHFSSNRAIAAKMIGADISAVEIVDVLANLPTATKAASSRPAAMVRGKDAAGPWSRARAINSGTEPTMSERQAASDGVWARASAKADALHGRTAAASATAAELPPTSDQSPDAIWARAAAKNGRGSVA